MFGDRDELFEWHEFAICVTPAQQGFDADHPAAGEIDLRLVYDKEVTVFQRGSQIVQHVHPLPGQPADFGRVNRIVAGPGKLGMLERNRAVAQQIGTVGMRGFGTHQANREGNGVQPAIAIERLLQNRSLIHI